MASPKTVARPPASAKCHNLGEGGEEEDEDDGDGIIDGNVVVGVVVVVVVVCGHGTLLFELLFGL